MLEFASKARGDPASIAALFGQRRLPATRSTEF
jgi:hypothetical protein